MPKKLLNYIYLTAGGLLGGWFFLKYGLPVLLPFLIGAGLALAAEPLVRLLDHRLPRFAASGIGVAVVFVLLMTLLMLLAAFIIREAGQLAQIMPDLVNSTRQGLGSLRGWLLDLSEKAPEGVRPVLEGSVVRLFSGSDATMDRFTDRLLGVAAAVLSWIASGALTFATAVLAAFMLSAKLPRIRAWLHGRMPDAWQERFLPAAKGVKHTLTGWVMAQLKLSGLTMVLLLVGFWILQIPHGPVWAVGVGLVDAFPVLGTGTVLIPWSLICLLQGETVRGTGLLGLYGVVWLVRSVMEPRLLGKELGLDPLVTLIAIYAGYKLLGLVGMILAPLLAVAVVRLTKAAEIR